MPRIYPFANTLRLKKNIIYTIPPEEGLNINLITISSWMDLVLQYTNLDLPEYSPEDMIRRYILGELKIDKLDDNVRHKDGKVEILSFRAVSRNTRLLFKEDHVTTDYLLSFLMDDVVYDSADSWYITYEWEPVSREILFHCKDRALWYRPMMDKEDDIMKECSKKFIIFCFEYLNKKEIYRILPKDYVDKNTQPFDEIVSLGNYIKGIYHAA